MDLDEEIKSREEGKIGSESRKKGDLLPCSSPLLKEGGVGARIFMFLRGKLLYFFRGLCDYSDKFPKMFCSSYGMECPSTRKISGINVGQKLNLSQISNKAASSVDNEKLLNEYFHRGYSYAAIVSLLEKRYGVRMHVRVLKTKLKKYTSKTKTCSRQFSLNFYVNHMPFIHYLEFYLRTLSQSNTSVKLSDSGNPPLSA